MSSLTSKPNKSDANTPDSSDQKKQEYRPLTHGESAADKAESVSLKSRKARSGKSSGAFRTISEVADELGVQQHVLRFWETKFSHVRPLKRGGGRRYYRPEDVDLLKRIHHL